MKNGLPARNKPNVVTLWAGGLKYKKYRNATYNCHCWTTPGIGITENRWLVMRETITSGDTDHAQTSASDATIDWNKSVDDLATVNGYTYS